MPSGGGEERKQRKRNGTGASLGRVRSVQHPGLGSGDARISHPWECGSGEDLRQEVSQCWRHASRVLIAHLRHLTQSSQPPVGYR